MFTRSSAVTCISLAALGVAIALGATPAVGILWDPPALAPGLDIPPGLPNAGGAAEMVGSLSIAGIQIALEQGGPFHRTPTRRSKVRRLS